MSAPGCSSSLLSWAPQTKNIRLSFNACGLTSNVLELKNVCRRTASISLSYKKHILNRIGLKPAASQAMSNYERTGHTVGKGAALYYRRSLHCGPINIPPLTNMEATGCRLAMTGHSTLVIVSVYLPSPNGCSGAT
ncbi:hypothetical protein EVAR_75017_1 [Eumeta japonica]|uniref:Uncharacterized protein n=1 Tax=Eumeta variegata TaxID=151549 RepID=A0A4C1VBM5_EUMVA|nr:hypothetical protein EVAR_75017_1 [Eumeta japonica]